MVNHIYAPLNEPQKHFQQQHPANFSIKLVPTQPTATNKPKYTSQQQPFNKHSHVSN